MINKFCLLEVIMHSFLLHIVRNINFPVKLLYIYMFHCIQVFYSFGCASRERGGGERECMCVYVWSLWQTEGHSFRNCLNQWVIQYYAIDCYRSTIVLCSVLYLYGSCEIQFRTKSFHLWLLCEENKSHTNHAGENFVLNFLTQHVHLEIQFLI
jgi:hypothetical protein